MHAVVGGHGPPVVLVHGLGVSGAYMLPLARLLLARLCSVFVPDLPGQGQSGRAPSRWGLAEMAETLGMWLEVMEIRDTVVVANSLGCQVVTELAVRRPELLGPLVLVGPTMDPARRSNRRQLLDLLRASAREPLGIVAFAARDTAAADVGQLVRSVQAAIADRIEERLPLIRQPAVVVHGEEDAFVGRDWAERAAGLLPDGRLVVIPSEAHAAHYTRPDLVAEIVLELLDERRRTSPGCIRS
jgi:2-hydroxy-6-oxonona-2,4-dienedioate hydrolase